MHNVGQVRRKFRRAETKSVAFNQVWSFTFKYLKSERAGDDRPSHVDGEAKPAFASRNIEIETAVAEVQVPRWAEGIVDGAEHLPIAMRADPKAADTAVGCQPEPIAELAVIAPADQRVGPAAAGFTLTPGSRPGLSATLDEKPPRAKAKPGIGELHWVLEEAVKRDPGAGIRLQRSVAAIKPNFARFW